ncbi:cyclic nucleotide-binding domain-containing protein [Desulfogranum japonicum]|uniref:cyclic nucleotide-binding domain-containing protein n=1 Tax=Desulfogranum japonicum TaxID=231447 RepID=UPI00041C8248|nr:cyclic nucleotide-binding domain-containing protein [Desulfogranum japonicum]
MNSSIPSAVTLDKETEATQNLLAAILSQTTLCTFKKQEQILASGSDKLAFYYVQEGTVEVSYTDNHDTRITVALIGQGEFFGEIGFFDGETRVRDIRAIEPTRVAVFTQDIMDALAKSNSELYIEFLHFLTKNICAKFRRIASEREPIAGYADSLASRRSTRYSESKPLPTSLIHSSGWGVVSRRMEEIKAELFNLSHKLQQAESSETEDRDSEERCFVVLHELNTQLNEFKNEMDGSGHEEVVWGYVFKEIYPYFMRSHFAERAYFKPKGYAGDFLMMEHIYRNEPVGEGKLGEIVDKFCLQRPGSLAIRGRRELLKGELMKICGDLASLGKPIRIMNLACGPNRELFDFIKEFEHDALVEALCVDIDTEALRYTNQYVNVFPHLASIRLMSENVIKWSLGRVTHTIEPRDIIYSAGLCDYLDVRLFRALVTQCYNHLKPGGKLLLGNFTFYSDSLFLDKLLKWELIYRTEADLQELFAPTPFGDNVTILAEENHVNLFALAEKDG